jgi:NAD(P)-dependent dehydrogenase (short-subunit alcohol dehydrogenase family)
MVKHLSSVAADSKGGVEMVEQDPQLVLITGASSGFGLKTSLALAQKGYRVVATMRRVERGEELLRLAEQSGVRSQLDIMSLDVTDEALAERTVKQVIAQYGKVDVLINNAGYALGGFVEDVSLSRWKEQFETNFFGLVKMTQCVLPHMRSRRRGKIINISSISGLIAFPALAPYASSKFAVEGFSEALRMELLPHQIFVTLIGPGSYKTSIWEKGLAEISAGPTPYADQMQRMRKMIEQTADQAADPSEVVETIIKVMKSKAPALRYPVGRGVSSTVLMKKLLPWSWIEKLVLRRLGSRRS